MKVLLVSMPWASLHRPSLALGVLASAAKTCSYSHTVEQLNANIQWIEYTLKETNGELGPAEFSKIADNYFLGAGEWVFTNALYGTNEWKVQEFCSFAEGKGLSVDKLIKFHNLSPSFIQKLAEEISSSEHDLIGFSSSFLQNIPSLALAKRIKQLNPKKKIAFGGANCDGIQGITLHKNFSFVDYVVRGEGEETFKSLLDALEEKSSLKSIGGLCWRNEEGIPEVNLGNALPTNMNTVPAPDYSEFFRDINKSSFLKFIEPELILESSRGCWWGEKHQCTFCGLNGSFMNFRSKSPEIFLSEIENAVKKYRVMNISLADNILDMKYFKSLLPKVKELDWDLKMFVEIKANISREQVSLLKEAGFVEVQPGIESLNSRVLKIMNKGVKGVQNIRLLRDCKSEGITVNWNYLYGFPEERSEDYEMVMNQIDSLSHLDPPIAPTRVALERFSPYFNKPELKFENLGPSKIYSYIYDLPISELNNLVYVFESPDYGLTGEIEEKFENSINQWHSFHSDSSLRYIEDENQVIILDRRSNKPPTDYILKKGVSAESYLILMHGYSLESLKNVLLKQYDIDISLKILEDMVSKWLEQGLIFWDGEGYVSLATEANLYNVQKMEKELGVLT